jgi:hypothetical protein
MLETVKHGVADAASKLLGAIGGASEGALQAVGNALNGRVLAAGAAVIVGAGGLTGCAIPKQPVCGRYFAHILDSIRTTAEPNLEWPTSHSIKSMTLPNNRTYTVVEEGGIPSGMKEVDIKKLVTSVEKALEELSRENAIIPGLKVGIFVEGPRVDKYKPSCRHVRVAFTVGDRLGKREIGLDPTKKSTLERGKEHRWEDDWKKTLYGYAIENNLLSIQLDAQEAAPRQTPRR